MVINYMKRIIIIAAPTGGGESTITNGLLKLVPNSERFVTTTSRAPRGTEQNGVDYNFISKEDFKNKIEQGYFLEYTHIENRDDYYGTPLEQVKIKLAEGKTLLFNYDRVGVEAMRKKFPDKMVAIFIEPESLDQIKNQLLNRDPNFPKEQLEMRLKNAAEEIQTKDKYDFVVINRPEKINEAISECLNIINSK